jgi:6-phosphofructokinase 1
LLGGQQDAMVGVRENKIVYNDFSTIMSAKSHDIDPEAIRIARILSI